MVFNARTSSLSRAAVVSFTTLLAAPVLAQDVGGEALEEVVVTGTNIRGAVPIGNPIQTLGAEQIAESGKATVAELLRELPVNFAGGVAQADNNRGGQDTSSAGSNLTGGSGVNLRGLGALSTLVLVDGRRVATSGQFGDFVDVANIPAAAIERIEILQDGASAVYGSDAVGGVVNFILKRNVEGLQTLARIGTLTEGGGDELQASAAWGHGWDSGRVTLGYEYNDRGRVTAADRDLNGDLSSRGGINWPIYTTHVGSAANIFPGTASFNGNVAYTVPQGPGTGLTVAQLTPATGGFGNSSNPWNGWDILPEMKRHSLFLTFDQDITDGIATHGSARYTRRDGNYHTGYVDIYGAVPTTNPAYIGGIGAPNSPNNFSVLVDDILTQRDVQVDSYGADLGVTFDIGGDWQLDVTGSYSREIQNRQSQLERDANIDDFVAGAGGGRVAAPNSVACSLMGLNSSNIGSIAAPSAAQRFCAGLNYETFNPYSTEPLSAQVLSQLIGYEDLEFDSWVRQGTVKVDGTVFELPGGPLKLAVGVDYRKEYIDGELEFNYRSIDPVNMPYGATEREVKAAYAEFAVPLVGDRNSLAGMRALDLSLAVRHEDSQGLGDFTSTDPKFGLRYKPIDSLTVRASYGTSFHAPPMRFAYDGPQPVPGGNAIFYANAFYTAPCNTTLVELIQPQVPNASGACPFVGMVVSGGAGPTLQPEEADTWTAGLEFLPESVPGLLLSANYFNMQIDNRLVRITSGALGGILANYFATGTSPYLSNLVFNPDDALVQSLFDDPRFIGLQGPGVTRTPSQVAAIIYATQTNLASLKMDGVDLGASYGFDTGIGEFEVFANGTLLLSYDIQATPGGRYEDRLGKYESTGNPVKLKSRQGVSYRRGAFGVIATINYTDSYECVSGCYLPGATGAPTLNTAPVQIDDWITLDLQFNYKFEGAGGLLSGAGVGLSVLNATNEEPPFVDTGRIVTGNAPESYDAANAIISGRAVALTLTKSF
ncbi:TonB-dependent receptor plug domain-containing protein [Steroidobacter agaridevorans]|uniref:TonB-dependent receptor plug domain-containing protein n=1 Tax=Steroidobacter agaridevorans TaxID=2695856 RepID=UPI001328AA5D|nr:TonB-dependent receptor [Steroidobacter agaridevorans]GFE90520.1 TonB-dependent receptor [Steroidobacter agaridevorans]